MGSTPSGRSSFWTFTSFSGGKLSVTARGKLPPWVELLELVWFEFELLELVWFEVGLVKSCAQGVKPFYTFTCYWQWQCHDNASEMLPFEKWITYHSNCDEISCSAKLCFQLVVGFPTLKERKKWIDYSVRLWSKLSCRNSCHTYTPLLWIPGMEPACKSGRLKPLLHH